MRGRGQPCALSGVARSVDSARRWQLLALGLAVMLASVALPAHQARGAGSVTRLDWGAKTPMPTARQGFGLAAAANGKLYAVGGETDSNGFVATVEEYDPATNTWTTKTPLPSPRAYLGLVASQNGKLYAVGGRFSAYLGAVDEYDPATDTWTGRAPLHDPRETPALAAAPNGKLYAAGGYNGGYRASLEEYDPATDTWTVKSPMSAGRDALALAAAPNGKLYAIGGTGLVADCTSGACSMVEEYDPTTDIWRTRASMITARAYLGLATASNGKLYAVGGENGAGTACDFCASVEEYDPTFNSWALRTSMPTARGSLGLAAAPNGRLYAVGGFARNRFLGTVEEYAPQTDTWAGQAPPLPFARFYAASATSGGRLYVFGGQTSAGGVPLNTVNQYDPSTRIWTVVTSMPTPRYGAAAVTAGSGKIYVVGGIDTTGHCPTNFCTTVEEYTPPTGTGGGIWRGVGDGIHQLPAARTFLGLALGANGKLYAVGGSDGSSPRGETYEYDPASNSLWLTMASMPAPRQALGVAPGGDGKLYAVGGVSAGGVSSTVERFVLPTAGSPQGRWEGPSGVAQLPSNRTQLGLVGLPGGQLIAAGGTDTTASSVPRSDVYQYDPAANTWTPRPPLPTASYGLSLALLGARSMFASGGFDGHAPLPNIQEGDLDVLPTVSAGGPYIVAAGSTVQLGASGSDPDGDPLDFAWDLDGSLLFATSGQNVVFSAAGLTGGTRTVRVRALDHFGGYTLASTTVTVQTFCGPRPNVTMTTRRVGTGQLQAIISAQSLLATPTNTLQRIVITGVANATALLNGSPVTVGSSVTLPAGTTQATLLVQRQSTSAGSTVSFTATDACGDWRSFVGGGPGAF